MIPHKEHILTWNGRKNRRKSSKNDNRKRGKVYGLQKRGK